jgi:hypothetical protein
MEFWEAALNEANDQNGVALADLSGGPTEHRTALVIRLALPGIEGAVVPFGRLRLLESNACAPLTLLFVPPES